MSTKIFSAKNLQGFPAFRWETENCSFVRKTLSLSCMLYCKGSDVRSWCDVMRISTEEIFSFQKIHHRDHVCIKFHHPLMPSWFRMKETLEQEIACSYKKIKQQNNITKAKSDMREIGPWLPRAREQMIFCLRESKRDNEYLIAKKSSLSVSRVRAA